MSELHRLRGDYSLRSIDDWKRNRFAKYTGTDRKDGLIAPNGDRYLIKYSEAHSRKNALDTSYVNNVLSEYLASHILSIIGYDVHETFLGTRNGELVVACKDFTPSDAEFIEFGTYLRKHYDSGDVGRVPSLAQIDAVLGEDDDLSPYVASLKRSYAERFVGDALVGNFDRHMGNWGYFIPYDGGPVTPSPIYDNGSTLFPALSESGMREILASRRQIMERTLLFPKAALSVNGVKVSYLDMLSSNHDPAFTEAVRAMVPRVQERFPDILAFIDAQPFLSETRKRFYATMLHFRMRYVLEAALDACRNRNYDQAAHERLTGGVDYTRETFERHYAALLNDSDWMDQLGQLSTELGLTLGD